MNIFVLMKRTFDTEEKIEISNGLVEEDGAEYIINPYDEYAVEEALRVKETHGGTVTVVTVGVDDSEKELRTALAMGADKALLIRTQQEQDIDHFIVGKVLADYLSTLKFDIILGGNVAIDDGAGQVTPRVAEYLNVNQVTTITGLEIEGNSVSIERDVEGDVEKIETSLPVLVTCQQGLNEPRYPSLSGIMKAKKKSLDVIELEDVHQGNEELKAVVKTIDRYLPPEKSTGKILEGEVDDQVNELIDLLKNEKKII